ncbi:PREDICTED: uncharacterized protein LOC109580279 [Amphimedon queenslandica]|uniref:Uncharacterized protein n=1 Tax=Amphimedon queenslandica TaxID=400682 RepID=A0A1X7VJJ9_AMPQE|nr:PREDICTED: uncharacterized protein LOC109580279 [Amphimedon queenslandica]|eukprot:XP_019848858.1 PREDICTED: uncharacterized protein LOC109580279 [Amphimedon queenslandica]
MDSSKGSSNGSPKKRLILIAAAIIMSLVLVSFLWGRRTLNYKPPESVLPFNNIDSANSTQPSKEEPSTHESFINHTINCELQVNGEVNGDKKNLSVVILGGMSQIGMQLALSLSSLSSVTVLEDLLNVDSDPMKWDRWTELVNNKHINAFIIEFKDEAKLQAELKKASPSTIIYVPTLLLHPVNLGPGNVTHSASYGTIIMKLFLRVIEVIRREFKSQLLFLSVGNKGNDYKKLNFIYRQWFQSLENVFNAYRNLHSEFSGSVIKLPPFIGEWRDLNAPLPVNGDNQWYIKDVIKVLENIIMSRNDKNCSFYSFDSPSALSLKRTKYSDAIRHIRKWEEKYTSDLRASRNFTIGAYFSHLTDNFYHRKVLNNRFSYMQKWIKSSYKFGLQSVIFHDNLHPMFVERIIEKFNNPKPIFLKVKSRNKKSPNDQRFYFVYEYLLRNKDVNMVMVNDVKDVEFLTDPALIMKAIGDYFYVGKDTGFILYTNSIQRRDFQKCYANGNAWMIEESMRLHGFLNVGVLGGTRASMLASLAYFVHCLDRTSTDQCCCDMSIAQYIYHTVYFDQLFIGYPFNMAFKNGEPGPFGMAVKHKDTFEEI